MGNTFSNGPCSYYCASLPECIPYHHMLLWHPLPIPKHHDESEHAFSGGSEGAMKESQEIIYSGPNKDQVFQNEPKKKAHTPNISHVTTIIAIPIWLQCMAYHSKVAAGCLSTRASR